MKCRWFQHLTRRSAVAEGQPASGVLFRSYQKLNGSKLVYTVKLKKYLIVFVCVCTVYLSAAYDVIMETYYYGAFGSKTPIRPTLPKLLFLRDFTHWPWPMALILNPRRAKVLLTHVQQEAQLSPRDRAMRRVNWNLSNCHATVQKRYDTIRYEMLF